MKQSSGLINVIGNLHQGNQQSLTSMTNLNAVVQTAMTLNAQVAQNQQLFRKTKEIHKIFLGHRKLKLRQIDDTLKISEGSMFTISPESFGMRKLFSKWVPRLRRYVTMDET